MKAIPAILLLVGIIAGPGYFFYCTSFSGASLDRVTVFSQDVSSFSAGGMTVQSSGANAQWNTPVTLALTPEMNPVSIQAIVRYLKPASAMRKRAEYRVTLAKDDKTVWEKTFSVSAKKEKEDEKTVTLGGLPKTTVIINTFSVAEGGQYTLDMKQAADHDLAVAKLELDVRRNVLIPSKRILIAGGAALFLGIVGLILSSRRRPQRQA